MGDFMRLTRLNGLAVNVRKSAVYAFEPGRSCSSGEFCLLYVPGDVIMVRETYGDVEYIMSVEVE